MQALININILEESNGEYYDCCIHDTDENNVQYNLNNFREYESVLPHEEVEANPEKYIDYKGSLPLPWEEVSDRKSGGSSSDDLDKMQKEIDELKELLEKQSKLLEELTNSKK